MLKKLLFAALLLFTCAAQAAVYSLPWGPKPQFMDANGAPMSSGSLLTFAAGSSTPQVTYTDSTGGVANPTTITLNTRGESPNEVWLTGGLTYKFVLKDSSGVTIWTVDNVQGVNDIAISNAPSEWIAGPAPTYVSATQFTLAGDQTLTFTAGRRVKTTNSGGTVYSTIVSSAFVILTTVTIVNDSSTMDAGLSAVSYGMLQGLNKSVPPFGSVVYLSGVGGTANAITASASQTAAPLVVGQSYVFTPGSTNTAATTININGLGAKNIFAGNSALVGGELHATIPVEIVYDSAQFQMKGPIFKQQTRTVLTSGAGTYTTPTGATRINVRLIGGGAGGGASTTNNGTAGNNSTFSTLTASGGNAGLASGAGGGAGGAASGGDINITGGSGTTGGSVAVAGVYYVGGIGGSTALSGGASGGALGNNGVSASANTGGGGGGGGSDVTSTSGGGGGGGGYSEKLFVSPAASYAYAVGAAANGGAAGAHAGGNGGSGIIIIDEYYN